jgi:hypothetical protein
MSRSTSAEAYNDLESKGVLRGQRLEVLRAFQKYGDGTSAEILKRAGLSGNLNLSRARVTELSNAGFLVADGERPCNATGRNATVWRTLRDGEEPKPLPRTFFVRFSDEDMQTAVDCKAGRVNVASPRIDALLDRIIATGKDSERPTHKTPSHAV